MLKFDIRLGFCDDFGIGRQLNFCSSLIGGLGYRLSGDLDIRLNLGGNFGISGCGFGFRLGLVSRLGFLLAFLTLLLLRIHSMVSKRHTNVVSAKPAGKCRLLVVDHESQNHSQHDGQVERKHAPNERGEGYDGSIAVHVIEEHDVTTLGSANCTR